MSSQKVITVNNIRESSLGYVNKPKSFQAEIINSFGDNYHLCVDMNGDLVIVYNDYSSLNPKYTISFYNDLRQNLPDNHML